MRIGSVLKHSGQAVLEGALIAMIVVGVLAGTAFAARGGGHNTTSSVKISVTDGVFASNVTATMSGASTSREWFHVVCTKDGTTALLDWEPFDSTGHATSLMGPTGSWTSGGASCMGYAGHYDNRSRWQSDASVAFTVTG